MIFDRWEPGIDTESRIRFGLQGLQRKDEKGLVMNRGKDLERESLSDLGYSARKEGEEREECSGILLSDLFTLGRSVIIKTKSQLCDGMCFDNTKSKFQDIDEGITKKILNLIISELWKVRVCFMAQSQLIGKAGDLKNGEGARKRLRISVPHFDNSEIIKNYSRTLIGRSRWQPKRSHNFPSEITFWIRVIGVPLEFWAEPSFETIGDAIGKTVEVDLDFGRVKVVVDGFKELVFDTTVDFTGGEFHDGLEEWISLKYEKLFGYCETCHSLCHSTVKCPLTRTSPVTKQTHKSDDGRGASRSERGSRDYYGKGKGKMIEEQNSKWTKVADREHKRSYSTRSHSSGDGESSRHRGPRRENQQPATQEDRNRDNRVGKERSPRRARNGGVREEGEIHDSGVRVTQQEEEIKNQEPPSKAFEEALLRTQEEPKKVISQIGEENLGLTISNELIEDKDAGLAVEEDIMDLDLLMEGKENIDEDFQDLTEEEIEEEEAVLKNTFVTGGTSKMRMVQTFLANPKKNAAKTGTRRGESFKQTEEKGSSNLQPAPPKP
ncbi:hypothetical protein Bca101_082505 [Brassica carinata]